MGLDPKVLINHADTQVGKGVLHLASELRLLSEQYHVFIIEWASVSEFDRSLAGSWRYNVAIFKLQSGRPGSFGRRLHAGC